jgi:hypothetical protein
MAIAEERELNDNLRRFKMLMETGEITTTRGQSHGPRSTKGKLLDKVFEEQAPNKTDEKSHRRTRQSQILGQPLKKLNEAAA